MVTDTTTSRHDQKKKTIVAAAMRLIVEKGMAYASLANIAKAAGISKGTLHYYYTSKNDLIFDVAQQHVEDITNHLFALINSSGSRHSAVDIVCLLFEAHRKSQIRIQLHLGLVQQAISGNDDLKRRFLEKYREWKSSVVEGLSRLLPDHEDPEMISHLIVAAVDGINIQSVLGMDDIPIEKIAAHITGGGRKDNA